MDRRYLITATLIVFLAVQGSPPAFADDPAQQLVNLVNTERARHGLATVSVSPELTVAARNYAQEMARGGFFAHVAPDGSTLVTRDVAAGYRPETYLEENLAAGTAAPDEVLAAWLNSPDHRANLLSPNVNDIGVGHVYQPGSPYVNYWVAEFGARSADVRVSMRVSSRGGERTVVQPSAKVAKAAKVATAVPPPVAATISPPVAATIPPRSPPASLAGPADSENLGRPLSGVVADPVVAGQTVQYFQRGVLEWHPSNPPRFRVERRLIGDVLHRSTDPPLSPADAPPGPSEYFPFVPGRATGLGHFVSDFTRDGQPIYFKQYFDSHGGVNAFGYPKDEPFLRDGLWTQRFQAAVFQYHPEYDRDGVIPGTNLPWRYFRVQLRLLGEQYIDTEHLSFHAPAGSALSLATTKVSH